MADIQARGLLMAENSSKKLELHPIALFFPMPDGPELACLRKNMFKAKGFKNKTPFITLREKS